MQSLQNNGFINKRYTLLMSFFAWLMDIPNKLTPPPFRLMQIGSLFWQSRVLYTATELNIADHIHEDSVSIQELAETLSLHEPSLYRLMRMLCGMGIFHEPKHGCFTHNKLSKPLVSDHPHSVRHMILMHNHQDMSQPWMSSLSEGIKTGQSPFSLRHGEDMFTHMDSHLELNALFTSAMTSVESLTGLEYLSDFDWKQFDRLIDVGGSRGSKSLSILAANPSLTATVFDRTTVVKGAKSYWLNEKIGKAVLERIDFVGGDFLVDPLPEATSSKNLYLFIAVFHLLSDQDAVHLLQKSRIAMGDSRSKIAIADAILPETQATLTDASFDMQMFMGTNGKERTEKEWLTLFAQAGFELIEIVSIRTFASVLIIQPNK